MVKKMLLVLVGGTVLLVGVLLVIGLAVGPDRIHEQAEAIRAAEAVTETAPKEEPKAPKAQASEWRTVQSWSGDGVTDTETFETKSREWRLKYVSTSAEPHVQMWVHDEDGKLVAVASGKEGVSTMRGRGRFHLRIIGSDWEVTVEDKP